MLQIDILLSNRLREKRQALDRRASSLRSQRLCQDGFVSPNGIALCDRAAKSCRAMIPSRARSCGVKQMLQVARRLLPDPAAAASDQAAWLTESRASFSVSSIGA
jgi:hypothetical protein